jgi:hypothetical protein
MLLTRREPDHITRPYFLDGKTADWMEKVSEEQYGAAMAARSSQN